MCWYVYMCVYKSTLEEYSIIYESLSINKFDKLSCFYIYLQHCLAFPNFILVSEDVFHAPSRNNE